MAAKLLMVFLATVAFGLFVGGVPVEYNRPDVLERLSYQLDRNHAALMRIIHDGLRPDLDDGPEHESYQPQHHQGQPIYDEDDGLMAGTNLESVSKEEEHNDEAVGGSGIEAGHHRGHPHSSLQNDPSSEEKKTEEPVAIDMTTGKPDEHGQDQEDKKMTDVQKAKSTSAPALRLESTAGDEDEDSNAEIHPTQFENGHPTGQGGFPTTAHREKRSANVHPQTEQQKLYSQARFLLENMKIKRVINF